MRFIALGIAATVLATLPAHADWKQYQYKDLGIDAYFPVAPTRTQTTYKSVIRKPLAKPAPAAVLTAKDGDIPYQVEVVDYTAQAAQGSDIAQEAFADAIGFTDGASKRQPDNFMVTTISRWDLGKNSVYGPALTIERKDKASTHVLEDIVFHKGKLYLISASVPGKSPNRNAMGLGRFMDTLQFYMPGYGYNYATGHDYPLGDNDPNDRDDKPAAPSYKPPPGLVSGPLKDGPPA
jgi:hypothetical protein